MKYIMVTKWDNHWDNLPNGETRYDKYMYRHGMTDSNIANNVSTLFIKISRSDNKPEKAWEGTVFNLQDKGDKVYFSVKIDREIPLNNLDSHYLMYSTGWYLENEDHDDIVSEPPKKYLPEFQPSFFETIKTTTDYNLFENYVFYLLKLIGINDVYKYEIQRGQADGFFIIGTVAVIYDATLDDNFEVAKDVQIKNYCAQLNSGNIAYKKIKINFSRYDKFVWVINRAMKSREINNIDGIKVKEISIYSLIDIYFKHLNENIYEADLVNILRNI